MWAEKEFRNLARLRSVGINAPNPIQLRMHILVMEFIGEHLHILDPTRRFVEVDLMMQNQCSPWRAEDVH